MAKNSKAAATKKSKPMPFGKSQDGVIGPKNRQDYGKKGRK